MSAIYDFFLADIQYADQKAPWMNFSNGCFSCLRTIFGGRKIEVLDGKIKGVEKIAIKKSDVRWIEVALSILALLVAVPIGIFPRICTFLNREMRSHLSIVRTMDCLARLLDENDKFPKNHVGWRAFQINNLEHPELFDPFVRHFKEVDNFSRKLCEMLVKESKGDQIEMVKLLKSYQFYPYFYLAPRIIYGNFRHGSIVQSLFVPGTPQYKIRERFNDLVDLWNRTLGDYDPNFKFSKDDEPHVAHESEVEVSEFMRIFLGEMDRFQNKDPVEEKKEIQNGWAK
jgi:hypothetical protein